MEKEDVFLSREELDALYETTCLWFDVVNDELPEGRALARVEGDVAYAIQLWRALHGSAGLNLSDYLQGMFCGDSD